MPYRHRLQASRFELKYLIDERRARAVRDFAASYLELDEHANPSRPHSAYTISSLYVDTPGLDLYLQTIGGLKNRFKLRIRFYNDQPHSPAFLEIKGRETDVIRKQRAAVTREGVASLLHCGAVNARHLVAENANGRSAAALERFCHLYRSIGAGPVLYVSYSREAYVSPASDQLRLTFDRHLMGSAFNRRLGLAMPSDGASPNLRGVVLEMKFTDRFPPWMRDLVETFDLERRSVAKYCYCVEALGYQPHRWLGAQREFSR